MENQKTLHQTLKEQTKELHEKAHSIPYIRNLLKSDIPIESYIGHLRSFAIIYGTLERQLSTSKHPDVYKFLTGYVPKLPFLLSDLEILSTISDKVLMPATSKALHVADKILLYSEESPIKLIGYLYTLDGSLNGGSVLKTHLSKAFGFENHQGISYFETYNEQYKDFWGKFTDTLNTGVASKTEKEDILSAAIEIFNDIMSIYESLYPFDEKDFENHVTALNPEAGNFPITTNPLEIEAAINAGQKCWNEFPYYEQRYGDRGKRFMVSDSVWLVNLCELPQEPANSQAKWLADYLARMGMPSYTIEIQLAYMYQELVMFIPEKEAKYKKLLRASDMLGSQRNSRMDSGLFENSNELFTRFCKEFKANDHNMKNTGKLIASSIADQMAGISESETNFKTWISNPEMFSPGWIQAVEKTYAEIKHQVESSSTRG